MSAKDLRRLGKVLSVPARRFVLVGITGCSRPTFCRGQASVGRRLGVRVIGVAVPDVDIDIDSALSARLGLLPVDFPSLLGVDGAGVGGSPEDAWQMDVQVLGFHLSAAASKFSGKEFSEAGCPFPGYG
ncbi:hypothetical protein [Streptomyces sp. NPDC053720]|uniref:hypothetical protein n=1 Tax=Streptomyces sp. NPDC053720 TaxID=3154855 RepID=UPI0034437741